MSMKKEDTNDHKTVEEPAIHSSQIHRVAHSLDIVAYIVLWYGISIGMTMFMKWFYNQWHVTGFPFPITTTACHMAIKLWISRLSRRCCIADAKFSILSRRSYWCIAVPIGLFTGLDVMLSSMSFRFVSVSFYTIIKSGSTAWNLIFSILLNLQPFEGRLCLVIALICIGIACASYGTMAFNLTGFLCVLGASICGTFRWVLSQYLANLIQGPHQPLQVLYAIAPASTLGVLPLVFALEGSALASSSEDIFTDTRVCLVALGCIGLGGVMAFVLILVEIALVQKTSALSLGIAGNVKDVCQILLSVLVFGDHLSALNVVGMGCTFTGMICYTVIKTQRKSQYAEVESEAEVTQEETCTMVDNTSDERGLVVQ